MPELLPAVPELPTAVPELPPGLWGVKERAATPFGKPRLFWQPTLGTAARTLAACSARAAAQTWAARRARAVARTRNHHAVIHVCLDCVRVCLVWRHPRVRRRGSWFPQPRPRCSRASQHIQHKGHCRCAPCWNRSDMVAIMDMVQWHGLCVIEDADQALLSKHGDRHLGSICHLACMSFHYTKNTVCGVSGVLLIKLPDLAYRARILREIGTYSSDLWTKKCPNTTGLTWVRHMSPASCLPRSYMLSWAMRPIAVHCGGVCAEPMPMPIAAARGHRLAAAAQVVRGACKKGQRPHLLGVACQPSRTFPTRAVDGGTRRAVPVNYVPLHLSPTGKKLGRPLGSLAVPERCSSCLLRFPMWTGMAWVQWTELSAFCLLSSMHRSQMPWPS